MMMISSIQLTISINTSSSMPFNFTYLDHEPRTISESSFQSLYVSDIPDDIRVYVDDETAVYTSSDGIDKIIYTGKDLEQRQAVEITDFPEEFTALFGSIQAGARAHLLAL